MKKITKVLALIMALVLCFSLAGCKKAEDGNKTDNNQKSESNNGNATSGDAAASYNYDITVWVPEKAVEFTQKEIANFNATNADGITFTASVEAVSEADAATTMITDVESGADIYFFAQDQAARLIQAGALSKLGVKAAEIVTGENASGVVAACMSGEDMYAYPLTADNGYFMYYDKSVIPEADIDDVTKLIADCEKAGRTFTFEMETSAWYLASYFFATGCVSEWTNNEGGKPIAVNDTFNSANGLIAAKGIYELCKSTSHNSKSAGSEFEAGIPAAIVISGTWDFDTVKGILGDNMGTADLPSFTVDGQSYHLGSYNGCKLLGVKPQTDAAKSACLHKLAQYLTSEAEQLARFNELAWGPANTVAQGNDAVQANPGLAALLEQAPYSIPQGQIPGQWWDIAKVIATDIMESDGSDAGLQKALDNYAEKINAVLNQDAGEAEAFTVIGAICGTAWDADFEMSKSSETGNEFWYSTEPMFLNAGEEFQTRQGKGWDVQFGALDDTGFSTKNNFVVPETGYYYVKLEFNKTDLTGIVSLVKNSAANGWTVIGDMNGDGWTIDIDMAIQDDGVTFKSEPITFTAANEFKVRQGHNWDVSYGKDGGNFVAGVDGEHVVVFDSTTGNITIE